MVQTYHSVYLSLPRHRPDPADERRRRRRTLGAGLTFVGLAAATLAAPLALARWVVTDPTVAVTAVDAALDDPIGRAEMERELDRLIGERLVDPDTAAAATAFGVDVDAAIDDWVTAAVDDPAVRGAIDDLVVDLHHRLLVEPDPSPLDSATLTTAITDVVTRTTPDLVGLVAVDATLVELDTATLPDLTGATARLDEILTLVLATLLALPLAVLVHPERHRVFGWVGRWLLAAGIAVAVAAVTAPYLAGTATGWSIVEIAVRSVSLGLVVPAGLAGIAGAGIVTAAAAAGRAATRRTSRQGAAAALGAFEPLPGLAPPSPPALDLTGRGLVDAGRPLTSI